MYPRCARDVRTLNGQYPGLRKIVFAIELYPNPDYNSIQLDI
jgi:hypothetical protein